MSPAFRRIDRLAGAVLWSFMRGWMFLLIVLTILIPASGRGELPEFGPPPPGAPFDDVDEATLKAKLGPWMERGMINGMLTRRTKMQALVDSLVKKLGPAAYVR